MTVIRNNSISGINSITAQSGALNFYDSTGNTLSIGADVTGGVTVATGATISGSTNTIIASTNGSERVRITSSGLVGIGTDNPGYKLHIEGTGETALTIEGDAAPSDSGGLLILKNNNTTANSINQIQSADAGGQTTSAISFYNVDNGTNEGYMSFLTRPSGGVPAEAARFTSSGNLRFPSGQGIDFSATANSSGTMTSELLSDYEEGIWTPIISSGGTGTLYNTQNGGYVRVGNLVYASADIQPASWTASGSHLKIGGLPFASASSGNLTFGGAFINYGNMFDRSTIPNISFHISWNGQTTIDCYNNTSALNGNASGVSLNARIILSCTYRTS